MPGTRPVRPPTIPERPRLRPSSRRPPSPKWPLWRKRGDGMLPGVAALADPGRSTRGTAHHGQDLVHHRRIPRLRPGVDDRRPRARRHRRRHRPRHVDPGRPRRSSSATRSCRCSSTSPTGTPSFAAVDGRPRPVRPARRRRQQRRLRPVRHDRGDLRGRGARPVRHQRVRRAVRHPGRAALPARAGLGPHPAGLQHRRDQRLPEHRHLQRLQVGARGVQPVARRRGRRLRHQGHDHRARRVTPPTGAAPRPSTPQPNPAYDAYREKAAEQRKARAGNPGRPGRPPATPSCRSWTPRTRRCGSSSATARWASPTSDYESRLATWREWEPVSKLAQG